MKSQAGRIVLAAAALLVGAMHLRAEDMLAIRVSPAFSLAPAHLIVTAIVQPDPDNRLLEIVAESAEFYRSSTIQLDGDQAPRTTQIDLRGLPTGRYDVRAVLFGREGERALDRRFVQVGESPEAR